MVEKRKTKNPITIGINGFGRIGRLVCRAAIESAKAFVTVINDPNMDLDYMVYQFKYDSVHGKFAGTVTKDGNSIIINGNKIAVYHEKDPSRVLWGEEKAVYVCECTGVFLTKELCQSHLKGGNNKDG
jgi:glyceraldehyde 3-phosphate dehydrogenase